MGGATSTEIELKLAGARKTLEAVFDALGPAKARSARMVSTYFDTPARHLAARGLSLRHRKAGRRQELTLKHEGDDLLERGEWTVPFGGGAVRPDLFPAAAQALLEGIDATELGEFHATNVVRRVKLVRRKGVEIEVALDIGRIEAAGRRIAVRELEFELVRGETGRMLRIVEQVLAEQDLGLMARSKAARGADLAAGLAPASRKAAPAFPRPGDTLAQALSGFVRSAAGHAAANIACVAADGGPEGVHQLRVALRRLRSVLGLFRKRLSEDALEAHRLARTLLTALGPARDLDVFVSSTLPDLSASAGEPHAGALERLAGAAAASRLQAGRAAREVAEGPQLARLVVMLLRLATTGSLLKEGNEETARTAGRELLDKLHARALERGAGYARLDWEHRHEVRIAVKKLRYGLDFFGPLFGRKPAATYAAKLERLQDDMGAANDAHVARALAASLARGGERELALAAAWLDGWQTKALACGEEELVEAWKDFRRAKPFWRSGRQ